MADRTINATFIPRRDTAANWESENPVLREGEYISVTTNAGAIRHKVGDGVKTYNQLPFIDEPLYNAMSDKADKVSNPTSGNFAALDSNGNLTDSGHKHSDYLTEHQSLAGKQDKITVSGVLKGNGSGGVSAAVAGTDYQAPLPSQTNNDGKFLTTNNNVLSWSDLPDNNFIAVYGVTTFSELLTAISEKKICFFEYVADLEEQYPVYIPLQSWNYKEYDTPGFFKFACLQDHTDDPWWGNADPVFISVFTCEYAPENNGNTLWSSNNYCVPAKTSQLENDNGFITGYTETDPVFTASAAHGISSSDISAWNAKGTYSKPSGGIPKADLASAVQTSLGKADTALQSYTETDPTVPAWAKATSKPSYTASEVGALPASTVIPSKTSDLTNDSGFLTQHQDISGKQDVIEVDGILEGDGEGNISAAETQEVTTLSIDNVPTPDSINLVKSGGVWTAIQNASGGGGDIASTTSVLKGDGNGGAVAATAGTDYQAPLVAGTDYAEPSDIPTKISDLQNDSGFITSYTETDPTVPSWAKATTKPTYTASEVGAAESSHVHGNITSSGDITATAPTVASGDQIIINDHSASKITNGPTFDGSTTSKYLSQKGTWESVPTISYPVTSVNSKTGAVVLSNTDVGAAATSHTHGNIQNGGTLQTSDITIANGDKLVVTDSSDSSKVARASISFDGSTTSKYLSQKGTWENAPTAASIGALTSESDPVFGASAAAGISSTDISNWNAKQNALTIDSTPTNGSGNPVSSDGAYDMVMSRTKIYTASCSTAASTTAKVATLDDSTGFSLSAGVMVAVRFTYGNSAVTPTLNVNSTGAKTIAIPSSATAYTTGSGTTYNTWGAYETILFTYTGTYWVHLPSGYLGYLAYNLASNALPSSTSIPTKVSDLQNDSGFISSYTETDPTVPSWAKASSKPSYTASEVGAAPTSHASTATTYGAGTSSNYGHVKLSDSTSSTSSTSDGIAATPAAVKAAYDLANGKQASITASGLLKGNGSGTVSAAVAGTDYQAPVLASAITTTTTWSGNGPYTQTVTLTGYTATANTKVDIQLTAAQITQLITDGVTSLLVSNSNGTLTVYATGHYPSTAMTIQVTCTEVTAA